MNAFERLFHLSRDVLAIAGVNGFLQQVNPAFIALLGNDEQSLLSRPFFDLVHPGDRRRALEQFERLADGTPSLAFEVRCRCRDGSYRRLAWRAELEGDRVYASARDVTEERHAEETSRHLADLLEMSDDAIANLDLDGNIQRWNLGAQRLYGYTAEEILGQPVARLAPERLQDENRRILAHLRRGKTIAGLETVRLRKDGREVHVALTFSPIQSDGRIVGSSVIAADITERRRAEEALEAASRAKSDFLANMSHEIRTPISGVIGTSRMLLELDLEPRARELAEIVRVTSEGLLRVIDDILDFSRVEAGKLAFESLDFRLDDLLHKLVKLLRNQAGDKDVAVDLVVADGVPAAVRGDPTRLRQVLFNLAGNAVKFTAKGKVTVEVESLADNELLFCIRDTGIGMGEETLERIFAPFTQADTSTARRFGGSGLGLAISKRIVEQMGGRIEARSTPGEGSAFTFTARFAAAHTVPETHVKRRRLERPQAPGNYRLLLAEDEPVNRMIGLQLIRKLGYRVDAATDGREAISALEKKRYDLVLMDCQMPELDGYEATRRIRQRDDHLQVVPIIAVTAHAMEGDREKCLAAGMDDYITKPYKEEDLATMLNRWLAATDERTRNTETGEAFAEAVAALEPAVDAGALKALRSSGDSSAIAGRAVDLFVEHTPPRLGRMSRALDETDANALAEIAHSLQGSASMIGALRLAGFCRDIERRARDGDLEPCRDRLAEVKAEYRRVERELRELHGSG